MCFSQDWSQDESKIILSHMLRLYGIFTFIWAIFGVNVGRYSIHGASGYGKKKLWTLPQTRFWPTRIDTRSTCIAILLEDWKQENHWKRRSPVAALQNFLWIQGTPKLNGSWSCSPIFTGYLRKDTKSSPISGGGKMCRHVARVLITSWRCRFLYSQDDSWDKFCEDSIPESM